MIRAVIFDMDGTITQPLLDFDLIRQEIGLPGDTGNILEMIDKMPPEQKKQAHDILEKHEDLAAQLSVLNGNVGETLKALRKASIKIGILTRNKRSNVTLVAEMHNLKFDAVYAREDGPVKPDAFGVHQLCDTFNVAPADTVVVGDFLHDLLSAKAAGAIAVLIRTHSKADEYSEYADFSIEQFDEIIDIIQNFTTEGV